MLQTTDEHLRDVSTYTYKLSFNVLSIYFNTYTDVYTKLLYAYV